MYVLIVVLSGVRLLREEPARSEEELRGESGGLFAVLVHPADQGPPQRQPAHRLRGTHHTHRLRIPALHSSGRILLPRGIHTDI